MRAQEEPGLLHPGPCASFQSWSRVLLLPSPGRSSCGLLNVLLARRLILWRELDLRTAKLDVVGIRGVLQDALLIGEVAGVAELQLPKTRVVVVALDGELVLCLYVTALVLRIPKIERNLSTVVIEAISVAKEIVPIIVADNKETTSIRVAVVIELDLSHAGGGESRRHQGQHRH